MEIQTSFQTRFLRAIRFRITRLKLWTDYIYLFGTDLGGEMNEIRQHLLRAPP